MPKDYSAEELTSRWEDIREIENLIGRRAFYTMLGDPDKIWRELWCKKAPNPSMGFNHGYYQGYHAVEGWFQARKDYITLQTELVKTAFPDKLGGKTLQDILNVGNLNCENVSTPLIELAGDGQTAKGLWYVMGTDLEVGPSGQESSYSWGRLGVDFVKEDGAWKIWHTVFAQDLLTPTGESWSQPEHPEKPADPRFAQLQGFRFPKPNVPMLIHERFHSERVLAAFPPLPVPYDTFGDTFSYGV